MINILDHTAQDFWPAVLTQLQTQMAQATFDTWLRQTRPVATTPDSLTIGCASEAAVEWLSHRLAPTITRTVQAMAGSPLAINYVNGKPRNSDVRELAPGADDKPRNSEVPAALDGRNGPALDLARVNHLVAGYAQHSDYVARFWRPYLGIIAFSLWDYIRAFCKDASREWTPPMDFTASGLARSIGCSSQALTGVWRGCLKFDEALEAGEPLPKCCQYYAMIEDIFPWPGRTKETKINPEGRPTCRHWVWGALEILAAEGLAVVEQHGTNARSSFFTIQVWQHLPILSCRQSELLEQSVRIAHRNFLDGLLKRVQKDDPQLNISLTGWQQIDLWSFLPILEPQYSTDLELPLPALGALTRGKNVILFNDHEQIRRYLNNAQLEGRNVQKYIFFV